MRAPIRHHFPRPWAVNWTVSGDTHRESHPDQKIKSSPSCPQACPITLTRPYCRILLKIITPVSQKLSSIPIICTGNIIAFKSSKNKDTANQQNRCYKLYDHSNILPQGNFVSCLDKVQKVKYTLAKYKCRIKQ